MAIKLIKACKELNIGMITLVEASKKHGREISCDPNARIDDYIYLLLAREFKPEIAMRLESEGVKEDFPSNDNTEHTLPLNHGKPWSQAQEDELCRLADAGELLGDISKRMGRSVRSIEMKLESLGYTIYYPSEEEELIESTNQEPIIEEDYLDEDNSEPYETIQNIEQNISHNNNTMSTTVKLTEDQIIIAEKLVELMSGTEGMSLTTLVFKYEFDRETISPILEYLREQEILRYDKFNKLWFLKEKTKQSILAVDLVEMEAEKDDEDDIEELPLEKANEQVQEIVTDSIEKLNIFAEYRLKNQVAARYWITQNIKGKENSQSFWLMTTEEANVNASLKVRHAGGDVVYKNSLLGIQLQKTEAGDTFVINPPAGRREDHVHNTHVLHTREIHIENDPKPYNYRGYASLEDFMRYLREVQSEYEKTVAEIKKKEEERQNENLTSIEKGQLTRQINKMKETKRELAGQRDDLLMLSNYIREQGSLRYNPVLDTKQSRIKTDYLYDGTTLIIDGGPGTGKTTTMIQRLKYLTDIAAIKEDQSDKYNRFKITRSQSEDLVERVKRNQDWMFFSPSRLLKLYLADAMNKDGLSATNDKVWDWSEFRKKALRDYGLFGVGKSFPFSDNSNKEQLIYDTAKADQAFFDFLKDIIIEEFSQLPVIEYSNSVGVSNNVRSIEKALSGIENDSLDGIIRRLFRLQDIQLEKTIDVEYELSLIADKLIDRISEDDDLYEEVEDLQLQNDNIEYEKVEHESDMHFMLKNWLYMYCFDNIYHTAELPDEYHEILAIIGDYLQIIESNQLKMIGEGLLYEQYRVYTKGVHRIILQRLPKYYKAFRKFIVGQNRNEEWNVVLLSSLIKNDKKQLHFQEQALLLYIINKLIQTINRISPNHTLKHRYINAYRDLVRPIIGIDEVTDFSKVELQAMVSFALNDYHSITMAGDLMQRLTVVGIQNWDALDEIVDKKHVVELRTSYRQSKRMLEVAQQLYEDTIGKSPNYVAKLQENKVPRPLMYTSDSEAKKIRWIEKRIEEVYKAYSNHLPATAIFLNSKDDVSLFVEEMRKSATLQDAGIEIVDGSAGNVTGSRQEIRVYPINVVKGLEFDVVFFHNIDSVGFDDETIKRYIYVGVSRAAFFLGATMSNDMPAISQYFSKQRNWKTFMDDDTTSQHTKVSEASSLEINPIDELILQAMPKVPNDTSGISDEVLLKVATLYLANFREQVRKYEDGGRLVSDKPDMKQKRQVPIICDMISKQANRELWGNKYPAYKVYFILAIYMSLPTVEHSWWEETFAKGICDYLEWCTFFKGSNIKINNLLNQIK